MVRFEPLTTGVVTSESVSRSSTITDNPVEGGSNIQDHVFTQPLSFQISGTAINGADTIAALQKMWKSGDIITYTGRNRISNLVIQQLQSTHDAKNRGGLHVHGHPKASHPGQLRGQWNGLYYGRYGRCGLRVTAQGNHQGGAEVFLPNLQH